MTGPLGWDHPDTARYYDAFCRKHTRYLDASRDLAVHASIEPGHRVLDFAAGTGGTAEQVLRLLGGAGRIVCYEPARAMRDLGRSCVTDSRIEWTADLPNAPGAFDRVVCSAAVWQLRPFGEMFRQIAALLPAGGAFCCNVPSAYLGRPDEPGGGEDPYLCRLAGIVAGGRLPCTSGFPPLTEDEIAGAMEGAGLRCTTWRRRSRLTQDALRDWLKIPVLTDALLPDLDADARARTIDEAFAFVDPGSWRWEEWTGFSGRKSVAE